MANQERPTTPRPALDENIQAHIGQQLKQFYNTILTEPLPGKFEQLLDELEQKERGAKALGPAESREP
jgi:hypothetical protein